MMLTTTSPQVYRREVELIPRWQEGGSLDRGAPLRLLLSPLLLLPRLLEFRLMVLLVDKQLGGSFLF